MDARQAAYINKTIKKVVGNDLSVEPLFQFLNEVTLHSSQQELVNGFASKWKEKFQSSMSGIILCYIKDCWMPNVCDSMAIRKQPSWISFVEKYIKSKRFCGSIIGSQESSIFQPTGFEDLLQLSFWMELYDIYGVHVVDFIFNKCLIILPLADSFYHCIGYRDSLLQKKIKKYPHIQNYIKSKVPFHKAIHVNNNPSSSRLNGFSNPYCDGVEACELTDDKIGNINFTCWKVSSKRKQNIFEEDEIIPLKKLKMSTFDKPQGVNIKFPCSRSCKKQKLQSNIINEEILTNSMKAPVNSTHKIQVEGEPKKRLTSMSESQTKTSRWITPKLDILQRIRDDRKKLLESHSVATSMSLEMSNGELTTELCEIPTPTFINIMNDKYFKGKLDFITKEKHKIIPSSFASNLSSKLVGLRLPPELSKSKENIDIIIHRISETTARKYMLNVKPRKRYRQNRKSNKSSDLISSQCVVTENPVPPQYSWEPFDPKITLSTAGILYIHSSCSTWPSQSDMSNACSTDIKLQEGISLLHNKIIKYPVSLSENLLGSYGIQNVESEGGLTLLRTIIGKIVLFHRRVKNTNTLIKNCVKFWESKRNQNQINNKLKRTELKKKKSAGRESKLQVIDLTENTPSDSTDFSNSSQCINCTGSNSKNNENLTSLNNQPPNILEDSTTSAETIHQYILSNSKISDTLSIFPVDLTEKPMSRLQETSSPTNILSALSQILYLNGGIELLGSNSNRKSFFKFLKKSIFMGGIKSSLHCGELIASINPNTCRWLDNVKDYTLKLHLLAKVLIWLFNVYILNILKMGFYITDVSHGRMEVYFFLRDTWRSISEQLKLQYIKCGKLHQISPEIIPTAKLRLIPKKNNHARTILSLTPGAKSKIDMKQSIILLNYITRILTPHGIIDGTAILDIWKNFLKQWKSNNCPKLYFIRVDIRDAFPSVCIMKLKQILKKVEDEKLLMKRIKLIGKTKNWAKNFLVSKTTRDDNWYDSIFNRPCIIQDTDEDTEFDTSFVLSRILYTLSSTVIKIGKHNYTFENGLPQGWALSQALCNIYYGHMDQTCFSEFLNTKLELFLRLVDDYFYISPDPNRISKFFQRMRNGIPDYQCTINPDKSLSNIYVNSNLAIETHVWVPFCGWRFCLTNGHVSRDFSSYFGQDICSTLSFNLQKSTDPEKFIFDRMGRITPLRLKILILDPEINCRNRILTSLFEAGLMLAFRFYALCRILYPNLNAISNPVCRDKLLLAIDWCATNLSKHIRVNNVHLYKTTNKPLYNCNKEIPCYGSHVSKNKKSSRNDGVLFGKINQKFISNPTYTEFIRDKEVIVIVYHAFIIKLREHYSIFKGGFMDSILEKRNKVKERLGISNYNYLLNVIGLEMPEHFRKIKT